MIVPYGGLVVDSRTVYQLVYEQTGSVQSASYAMMGAEQGAELRGFICPGPEYVWSIDDARAKFAERP